MPGINGIEVAQRLREKDKSVIIAFLTNYSEFATKGYEVSAFRYILKEEPESMIKRQIQSIVNEYYRKQKCCRKHQRCQDNHKNKFHNLSRSHEKSHLCTYSVWQNLSVLFNPNNMLSRLEGFGFVKTHQSYVVNMSFIESIHVNSGVENWTIHTLEQSAEKRCRNCVCVILASL